MKFRLLSPFCRPDGISTIARFLLRNSSLELTYRLRWSKSLEFGAYGTMRYQVVHNAQLGVRPELAAVVRGTF